MPHFVFTDDPNDPTLGPPVEVTFEWKGVAYTAQEPSLDAVAALAQIGSNVTKMRPLEGMLALTRIVEGCVVDSHNFMSQVRASELPKVGQLMNWIVEQYSGRPTGPSADSPTDAEPTESVSTAP